MKGSEELERLRKTLIEAIELNETLGGKTRLSYARAYKKIVSLLDERIDELEETEYAEITEDEKHLLEEIAGLKETVRIYETALKRQDDVLVFVPNGTMNGTDCHVLDREEKITLNGKEEFYRKREEMLKEYEGIQEDK